MRFRLNARLSSCLIAILVMAACRRADVVPTAAPTPQPTAEAAVEPTQPPPTDSPAEPTAEPTSEPEPTATPVPLPRVGLLRFSDTDSLSGAAYQLQMSNVTPAPAGSHYELWLIGDDGRSLNLGNFTVENGSVDFQGTAEVNLIGNYTSALIYLVPDSPGQASANSPIVFSGTVPLDSLVFIRNLVYQFGGNLDQKAFLPAADEQATLAADHAALALNSMATGDLSGARLHAEHVVNILEGENGPNYGDLDGDGRAQNPGDGAGVLYYLEGAREQAQLAADTPGATEEVRLHAGHVIIATDNAQGWLVESVDNALHVISADTVAEAQPFADELGQLTQDIVNGRDLNGDNYAAPAPGEGAIKTAYEHAIFMGGLELFAGTEVAELPPAPAAVVVDMLDFTYSQVHLTIPAGTTVTWVNVGALRHSATASDGSWDTGLLDIGGEASITFDEAGTFAYYCTLHGTATGQGMAGTVTVVAAEESAGDPQDEEAVDMLDFSFDPQVLTIATGTLVTWQNVGEVPHSATADDGSWDTGVFDAGGAGSITFDSPGAFPYYCTLHGTPGGRGMAGTIVVVPRP